MICENVKHRLQDLHLTIKISIRNYIVKLYSIIVEKFVVESHKCYSIQVLRKCLIFLIGYRYLFPVSIPYKLLLVKFKCILIIFFKKLY